MLSFVFQDGQWIHFPWPPAEELNISEELWQRKLPKHFHVRCSSFQNLGFNLQVQDLSGNSLTCWFPTRQDECYQPAPYLSEQEVDISVRYWAWKPGQLVRGLEGFFLSSLLRIFTLVWTQCASIGFSSRGSPCCYKQRMSHCNKCTPGKQSIFSFLTWGVKYFQSSAKYRYCYYC